MQRASRKISKSMKKRWRDEDYRKAVTEGLEAYRATDEWFAKKAEISCTLRSYYQDPTNRAALSLSVSKAMRKMSKQISERTKAMWKDPKIREKIVTKMRENADELWGFRRELRKSLRKASKGLQT